MPVDADGNGINDDWEFRYFGQIGINPNTDSDGDGFSNLQEYLIGTDPTNNASAFRILSVVIDGTNTISRWATVGGKTNIVQGGAGDLDHNNASYSNLFYDMSSPIIIQGRGYERAIPAVSPP